MERDELMARLALLSEADATSTAVFQQAAAARLGLGITELRALSILLREGPQSAGSLGTSLHVTSGAVTGVVDRLVARGVATREPHPDDRRRIVVTARPEGLGDGSSPDDAIGSAFNDLYDGYTDDELEFLARHLAASVRITGEQTRALRASTGPDLSIT